MELLDSAKAEVGALLGLRNSNLLKDPEFALTWTGTPKKSLKQIRWIAEKLNKSQDALCWLYNTIMEKFQTTMTRRNLRNVEQAVLFATQIQSMVQSGSCQHAVLLSQLGELWAAERQYYDAQGIQQREKGMVGFHTFLMKTSMHSYALSVRRPPMICGAAGSFRLAPALYADAWWMDYLLSPGGSTA